MSTPAPLNIASLTQEQRLAVVLERTGAKLGPAAAAELKKLATPQALAGAAVFLVAWIASHAIGIGMIVDALMIGTGVIFIGMAVFDAIGHLAEFGSKTLYGRSDAEMNAAAEHLAQAISILGVQAVLALLLKGGPRTFQGGRFRLSAMPARTRGSAFNPRQIRRLPHEPAGGGYTTEWGEIFISSRGTPADRRVVALHESIHRLLTPELYILREFRVQNRTASYVRSALSKYLEEAFAETYAQIKMGGIGEALVGITFPLKQEYVTLLASRYSTMQLRMIHPVLPEVGGLIAGWLTIADKRFDLVFHQRRATERQSAAPVASR
jgi:hypothetical protein